MNENEIITEEETGVQNKKTPNHRLRLALLRAIAAVLVATILLAVTGFSVVTMIKGPKQTDSIMDEEVGSFVKRDIFAVLGFYADTAKGENVAARYAVVPMGGKLATVCFTNRYLESAKAVQDSTYGFVNGENATLDSYVAVQGTVAKLTEDESSLLYDWFGLNKAQLVEMRMIADTEDYADYLTDYVLLVDTVNYKNQTTVIVLSAIAAAFILYAVVELLLMGFGFYLPPEEKKKKHACDCCCGHEPEEEAEDNCGDGCRGNTQDDDEGDEADAQTQEKTEETDQAEEEATKTTETADKSEDGE